MDERAVGARGDRDGVRLDHVEDADGVGGHLLERLVAGDCGHGGELQFGARQGEQEGHGVVMARIAVDNHRGRHGASSWRAACSNAAMHLAALLITAVLAQAAPTATTGPTESITTGSAVGTGTVNPGGTPTTYHFDYGTTSSYGLRTPDVDAGAGTDDVSARATLTGLTSSTTYHYRLVAGSAEGADRTFKTSAPPSAPSISSRAATGVSSVAATLNAGVNPRGLATTVHFEYGTSTAYGSATPEQPIGAGSSTVSVSVPVGGLRPGTKYNFRAVATSAAGVKRGSNRSFTTSRAPTAVAITPSTVRPTWGTGLTITGVVSGTGSIPVALEKVDFPFTADWTEVATASANASGAFVVTVPPLFVTTRMRVVTRTPIVAVSAVTTTTVTVKVGLKTRRLPHHRVRLEGTTQPAVPAGRASLQRQSRSGRWVPVSRTGVSSYPGGRSRYRFTVARRKSATTWRVVVNPRDGGAHGSGASREVRVGRR